MTKNTEGKLVARVATVLLQVALAVEIAISAIVGGVVLASIRATVVMPDDIYQAYQILTASLNFVPWVVLVLVLAWCAAANRRARVITSVDLQNSPFGAAAWWFVPIASLYKPYQIVLEIYKASRNPDTWKQAGEARLIGWWWGLHLLGSFLGVFVSIISKSPEVQAQGVSVALFANIVVHQSLLFFIITRIDRWQSRPQLRAGAEDVF